MDLNSLISAQQNRDQAKYIYDIWNISVGILETLRLGPVAPIGSYPFPELEDMVMAIPVSKYNNIEISPDPIAIAQQMNVKLTQTPTLIPMTLTLDSNYNIYQEDESIKVYDSDRKRFNDTYILIPGAILSILAQKLGPKLEYSYRTESLLYSNFEWPVYFVIPSE